MLQALQEPHVNLGQFLYALHAVALFQSLCYGEDTQIGWVGKFLFHIIEMNMLVANKSVHTLTYHAQTLLYHLLE